MAQITQTTLSAAVTVNQTVFTVASATNLSAPANNFYQKIYVIDPGSCKGELMTVVALSSTTVTVSRLDEFKSPHLSGALVLICPIDTSQGDPFTGFDPPTVPIMVPVHTWLLNVTNGRQWLYSTVTKSWVPGFGNYSAPVGPTKLVASAAGTITPSGPLFHMDGTSAVTGFVLPNGAMGGAVMTIIPDAGWTWTTGDSSIAVGGQAVANKAVTFVYDWNAAKWYPSYVA